MTNNDAMDLVCDMFNYIDSIETHDLKEAQRLLRGEKGLLNWVETMVNGDWLVNNKEEK